MAALDEEWTETPRPRTSVPRRLVRRPVLLAAAVVLLAGAVAWGAVAQGNAVHWREDAQSYQHLLHALGGHDVRVGVLAPRSTVAVDGSAVLYDSDRGQSWALILVRAPGYTGALDVTLVGDGGRRIDMRPIQIDSDGEGSTWLVTSVDISSFRTVDVRSATGRLLAAGTARPEH
jgi:hypothetical protein